MRLRTLSFLPSYSGPIWKIVLLLVVSSSIKRGFPHRVLAMYLGWGSKTVVWGCRDPPHT